MVGVAAAPFTVKEPVTKVAPAGMVSVKGRFVIALKPTFVTVTVYVNVSPILAVSLSTALRIVGARSSTVETVLLFIELPPYVIAAVLSSLFIRAKSVHLPYYILLHYMWDRDKWLLGPKPQ